MFIKNIPNLLTFINLSFGVLSIVEVINQNYFASAMYIIISACIDRYDGIIARRLDVCSEFGKELDSLADLVSFGIAPALLIYFKFNFDDLGMMRMLGIVALLLYIVSSSYRLALFNIRKFEGTFRGIPITVAGFVLSTYSVIAPSTDSLTLISVITLLAFSYLMVSSIKFKKI
ncbi:MULTISPECIES: CDP-diacylglycerol--serine O-phosphatidyltransferase [Paenibacillus]|uniref:CDP-diacylglycerol--serine O-phosphatidyltransferase n=1 Tax=Paenibacillus TaxID=44249 RepID=UPI000F536DBD|nr:MULTISPECIES: CDP-diacylglycerol--serine O-phosphatidyltransferase [Paenibacillus]KAA8745527.1 CDP-diacylglycerol--serine O-phosphatidyltransferase [Paenibacillus sp. UASWS1643]RPK31314.1 CDP-diacylglycerol--serine O-phosphatidyltransferase [Paenibacillus xylanexedens]